MAKLTLYHAAPSRSSIVHWMLEELGEPYDIHLVSFKKGENRQPAYLAINPMGKLPALEHGDVVITEAAAICTYLADEFPRAKLNVPIGDPRRGIYLKWLFFGPSCVEPAVTERAFPRKDPPARSTLGFGDYDTVMDGLLFSLTENGRLVRIPGRFSLILLHSSDTSRPSAVRKSSTSFRFSHRSDTPMFKLSVCKVAWYT
jgi:hypothetical protein